MPGVRNEVSVVSQVRSWALHVPASKEPVFSGKPHARGSRVF